MVKELWEKHSFRHSQCTLVYQHSTRAFVGDLFELLRSDTFHLLGALNTFLMCVIPRSPVDLMSSQGPVLFDTERLQYHLAVSPTALCAHLPEVWQALARKTRKSSPLTLCKLLVMPFLSQQGGIPYCRKITKGIPKKKWGIWKLKEKWGRGLAGSFLPEVSGETLMKSQGTWAGLHWMHFSIISVHPSLYPYILYPLYPSQFLNFLPPLLI